MLRGVVTQAQKILHCLLRGFVTRRAPTSFIVGFSRNKQKHPPQYSTHFEWASEDQWQESCSL